MQTEIDITIEDRIRLIKQVDIGSLISNQMCDSLMDTVIKYTESLDCQTDLSSAEYRWLMGQTIVDAIYDITYTMKKDELKNG